MHAGRIVYVKLLGNGLYKIGCTENLKRRYLSRRGRDLVCSIPVPPDVNMYSFEAEVHSLFGEFRNQQAERFDLGIYQLGMLQCLASSPDPQASIAAMRANA